MLAFDLSILEGPYLQDILSQPRALAETRKALDEKRFFDPRTLMVAVSQSERSAEIIRLLEINKRRSPVVGVTNTAGSPLAAVLLQTPAG